MTQIPAGWYPDPDTSNPDAPRGQRYWDGQQWTSHVAPPPGASAQAPGTPAYTPMPAYGGGGAAVATTPDGQLLSGWWRRVAAYLLDVLIILPISLVLGWPWISDIVNAYGDLVTESMNAAENGNPLPDQSAILGELAVPFLMFALVSLAVNLVYNAGFLKWKAATPGKLMMGLRVRLREMPGPLSWGTVLMRWLGQNWYSLLGVVPVLGSLLALYPLLDDLWPLWDDKKQALHDKIAKTNVIRVR